MYTDFFDLIRIARSKMLPIAIAGAIGGGLAYGYAGTIVPKFSYSMLVRTAQWAVSERATPFGTDAVGTADAVKSETMAFLKFEYLENTLYREQKDRPAAVKTIEDMKGTDMVNIRVYGIDIVSAETHAKEVFGKLQELMKPRIEAAKGERETLLRTIQEQRRIVVANLQKLDEAAGSVGFNAVIQERRLKLTDEIAAIDREVVRLENELKSGRFRPYEVVSARADSEYPVEPRTKIITAIGALVAMIGTFLLFLEAYSRQMSRMPTRMPTPPTSMALEYESGPPVAGNLSGPTNVAPVRPSAHLGTHPGLARGQTQTGIVVEPKTQAGVPKPPSPLKKIS